MSIDVIGDVHGQADALIRMLRLLGYREKNGSWKHEDRTALFVGDYVDAGPQQAATLTLVRGMVDDGAAVALMGNHEFNAICWFTEDPDNLGDYLRSRFSVKHGAKNRKQHQAFLSEFEAHHQLHQSAIEWFLTLPLWFESGSLRVVHACWDQQAITRLGSLLRPSHTLTPERLIEASREVTQVGADVERILKGQEIALPGGVHFQDTYGFKRQHVRRRWWDPAAVNYRKSALLPQDEAEQLPDIALPVDQVFQVDQSRPTLFGHYCLSDGSPLLYPNFGCVDTCASRGKRLTAYQWDGEQMLDAAKFRSVLV